jgi:DNA-binding protein HU-beta
VPRLQGSHVPGQKVNSMTKNELAEAVARDLGESKAFALRAVDAMLDAIHKAVADGDKVSIAGHGVYEAVTRPARTGRNPATGETMEIAESTVPKFRAGSLFKARVAG